MAIYNLQDGQFENLVPTLNEADIAVVPEIDDESFPVFTALNFEVQDRIDLRAVQEINDAADIVNLLATANGILNGGGVRLTGPRFTLQLVGLGPDQLTADNFIFSNPPVANPDATTILQGATTSISVLENDTDPDGDPFSITGFGGVTNGTFSQSGDQLVYTAPDATFSGIETVSYTITDSNGGTDTSTVTVTVGGNQPPNAVDDAVEAIAGNPNTFDVLVNDSDFENSALTITQVSDGANGTVTISDNKVVYTPSDPAFTGTDSFTYTVSDDQGGIEWARVNVTVVANQNPIANPDAVTMPVGGTATLAVLDNDSDPNGQPVSIIPGGVSDPANGTVELVGNLLIYVPGTTPAGDPFSGRDTFTYSITDGTGGTSSATVTVTVGGPQPPIGNDDTVGTAIGVAVTVPVLANDTDANGDTLSISGVGTAGNGLVGISGESVVYTPNVGFTGEDSFTYTVSDGALVDTATVTVQVGGQLPPIATPDSVTSQDGTVVTIPVLANDTDPNGDALTVTGIGTVTNGTVTLSGNEAIYTPPADPELVGTDSFTYTISDGNGGTASADVTVTINRERPPIANPDAATIQALGTGTVIGTATINALENDSDPDGDTLSIVGVGTPDNGTASLSGNDIIYVPDGVTPDGNPFSGVDSFGYSITDGNGNTVSSTVQVTVGGNQPPVAVADDAGTPVSTPISIDVLANDSDLEGNTLSINGVGNPSNGSAVVSNNTVLYTPNAGFTGSDSFVYTVSDGIGQDSTTVTVTVGELPPVATNDTATVVVGQAGTSINVLANDSDPDGGTFSLTGVGNGGQGNASIFDNGTPNIPSDDLVIYQANSSFTQTGGTDTFTYTITNDKGRTDTATVTVLANQPPDAVNDTVTIQTLESVTIPVLANDTDPDGDSLRVVSISSSPDNGTAVLSGNEIVYTATTGLNGQAFSGNANFSYSITDDNGGGDTANVTVRVGGNQPPVASNDTATVTAEGGAQSIAVLANDTDPDTAVTSLFVQSQVGQGANGTVVINNNQAFYTPNSTTFTGTDSFVYTLVDPQGGGQDSATVTVIVQGNAPPLPQPDEATIPVGGSTTISVLANDSDPNPGDVLTVIGVSGTTTNGFTQLVGDNQVLFTTNQSNSTFEGTDTFTYTVRDSSGATATSTVTVAIGGNQPPVANPDSATVTNVKSAIINVLTNDSDPNGNSLTLTGVGGATNGTAIRLNNTDVLYTPTLSTTAGTDSFTYTVSDGNGGLDTTTVTVTINENGSPVGVNDTTTIQAGGTATIDVVANDSDPDGDALTVTGTLDSGQLDNGGTIAFANGQVIYTTPNTAFTGTEIFTYSVTDGFASAPGTVTVIVGGNQPPVADDDAVTTISGGTTSIAVLLGDSDPDGNILSITGVGTPTNGGSATIFNGNTPTNPADDVIVYVSPSSTALTATDSFTYSISDQAGGVDSATVTVTINGNQAPTANNDAVTVAVGSTSTIDVLENDSDPNDGDTLRIIGAGNASSLGSVTFDSERVIYTPNSGLGTNFTGTDSFTYTIADAAGVTATATGVVTLGGIQPPDAVRDTANTSQGSATTIDVLVNDNDPTGGTLTLTGFATTTGNGGAIARDTNGTTAQTDDKLIYTPNATFIGTDTFTYTVSGGNTLTDSAVVSVIVGSNEAPVASPDTLTIQLGSASTLAVLDNDVDPNGETPTAVAAGGNNTSLGNLTVTNGNVIYTPNSGLTDPFVATDSFTYTIRDTAGATSTATVSLTLGGNQPPTAVNDTVIAIQSIPTTIDVLANDTDPDNSPNGGTLSITGVGTATNGTVTIDRNGTDSDPSDDKVIYTSTSPTFTGVDSFVYSVTDGNGTTGATVSANVNVTVNQNGAPTAVNDIATVLATGASTINVLSNDTDPNTGVGDIISVTGVGSQANSAAGSVALTNGNVIYTSAGSAATFTGTDSFIYTVRDLNGNTSTASVSVTVGGPQVPTANPDTITVTQGSTATLSAGLTSNDSDPNGDTFAIVGVSSTTSGGGTANVTGGQVVYNVPTVAGTDTFTYSIADATGTSSATVTAIAQASTAPIGVNDTATTQTGTAATIAVLANDSDPDPGDTLQLVAGGLSTALNGTVAINGENVIYTPNTGFSGIDQFTYSLTDGLGGTASATVTVTVGGPQPPDAVNDTFTAVQAVTNTISVLSNDSDPDGGTLSITGISTATNGTVAINNNGTATDSTDDVVIYTTTSTTFTGTDSFTYTITDGQGNTDSATVSVTVEANGGPTAVNDSFTLSTATTLAVLDNDTDPNPGDSLSVTGVGTANPSVGSVSLTGGQVIYSPIESVATAATATNDSFIYTISDITGNTSTATVSVAVGGPQTPVANDDSVTITQGTTQTLSAGLTSNDSDPNGEAFSIVGVTAPTNGGTAAVSSGQVIYTATSTAGTDTFTYSITDGNGGTDAATVSVSVIAGSTVPVANDDFAIAIGGVATGTTIPVLLNDSDPNGDTLSITGVTITGSGTPGTVAINDNGTPTISSDDLIVYTPPGAAPATDTITYTITDGNGGTGTGTVTVGVFVDAAGTARSITGDANDNVLVGSDGTVNSESLNGGSGNDILIGRGGVDELTGGAGVDQFRFLAASDSVIVAPDLITDFEVNTDTIQIEFAALSTDVSIIGSGTNFNLTIGSDFFLRIATTSAATFNNTTDVIDQLNIQGLT